MFNSLKGFIWLDGKYIPWPETKIHIMSHALHYASSVYEGIRSYNNYIFKAEEHFNRLHNSAKILNFKIPYSSTELILATKQLLLKETYKEGYIRAISWCGSRVMTVSHKNSNVHTAIGIWERPISYPKKFYTEGIKLNISKWKKPHPDTAPVHSKAAGLYMISSISKKESEILGYNDSLMLDSQNYIAEATSSNIFFTKENEIYTPIPDCFLNGITRKTIIDIAKNNNISVIEKKISLEDLDKMSEAFLIGTAIGILPVQSIESPTKSWLFNPSKITSFIRNEYKKVTKG